MSTQPAPEVALKERPADRRAIVSWCLWDFGSNAYNTVILSFVFSVYVTSAAAPTPERGQEIFSLLQTVAGITVAVLAPMLGAWGDQVRKRRRMLTVATVMVVVCIALLWFVLPYEPGRGEFYIFLGAALIAGANVFQQIAEIFYNAMLIDISNPRTIGRISGVAWGLGYFAGVLCLILALFGFVLDGGMFGLPTAESENIRAIALVMAAWLLLWSIPVMIFGPEAAPREVTERFNVFRAYRDIARRLVHMWRFERGLLHFLIASAVYRDGLAAVFAFAGVIATSSYGFAAEEVIYFGLAANFLAAVGAWVFGMIDDRFGPRPVILIALITMVVLGVILVSTPSKVLFWVCGLGIASLVGAVQSSSRTLLARITPVGQENETFGLYATIGRAASFIAPFLLFVFTALLGARFGLLGIVLTLAAGLALFIPLRIAGVTHGHRRALEQP
ncbi:MFS transporter [Granulicoccus sp. GXG6511]|uniref:MFS transporter n=1 Tax=Granulicoccus sp. GXG6511 TaxID=3381351 RepID=UPI003D7CF795